MPASRRATAVEPCRVSLDAVRRSRRRGPHAHDEEGFDWWSQAFASRGYAVLQPNFRGSTNRDEGFMRAGFGPWGKAMQTDISDGVAELARRGVIDPARACIVGASYGGYAALAGVTLQQGT